MDLYCDVIRQRFAWSFQSNSDCSIVLTQNDDQPVRLFMVQPSLYPGTGHPFYYTEASGDEAYTAIISLRDVTGNPHTLASTAPMTAILNGFIGVLHLNTQEVADFLSGRSQRDVDFCIDLIDGSGHRLSPFRHSIILRAIDTGAVNPIPGVIYDPVVTGLTGGGVTNLDGVVTVGKALGTLYIITRQISGAWTGSQWKLIAGTGTSDEDAGVIRPLDYDGTINAVNWVRTDGL